MSAGVALPRRLLDAGLQRLGPKGQYRLRRLHLRLRAGLRWLVHRGRVPVVVLPGGRWRRPWLVVALGTDEATLAEIAAAAAARRPQAVVVTDSDAFGVLRRHGLLFESVPPRATWEAVMDGRYEAFLALRLAELAEVYQPERTVRLRPGQTLDPPSAA
ncbi:MAG: hypothetical protein R6T85_04565 [Egibacteraceae bacterium]